MATKGEIAADAYDTIGIGGNYESAMIMRGVKNLDRLMLSWENDGILTGYITSENDPSPDDDSGIYDYALQAVVMSLAVQLSNVLRMPVDPSLRTMANNAYKNLVPIDVGSMAANPYMPIGQGASNCFYGESPKYQSQDDVNILTESNNELLAEGL